MNPQWIQYNAIKTYYSHNHTVFHIKNEFNANESTKSCVFIKLSVTVEQCLIDKLINKIQNPQLSCVIIKFVH